ncbi:MAG: molecular chaperone TorD family protein [Gammaproteobacteria bacterium]
MTRTLTLVYLVAACLFDRPDPANAERLQALLDELLRETPADAPWHATLIRLAQHAGHVPELETEHVRLFVLAVPRVAAQPYASYWLEEDHQLLGDSAQKMRAVMTAHGVEVSAGSGLLPDHIVSELEFIAYLAGSGEPHQETRRRLVAEHLARWTPLFTAALRQARPSPRYRLASEFLDQLVAWDLEQSARTGGTPHISITAASGEHAHDSIR